MYPCVVSVSSGSTSGATNPSLCGEHSEALGGDSSLEKLYSFLTLGSNKVTALSTSNLIEMKTFKERPVSPALCSCSFSTGADEQRLLTDCDNESFTLLEDDYSQTALSCEDPAEEDFFLVIGGKPLSRHCEISIGQIMME